MDVTQEVAELTARIAALPDDAQWELAWGVLRRFGWQPDDPELAATMLGVREAVRAYEESHRRLEEEMLAERLAVLGYEEPNRRAAELLAEREAVRAREKANGKAPTGEYRAAAGPTYKTATYSRPALVFFPGAPPASPP